MSDMEGKVTRVGASERGQRTSFKTPRCRGKAKVDLQTAINNQKSLCLAPLQLG